MRRTIVKSAFVKSAVACILLPMVAGIAFAQGKRAQDEPKAKSDRFAGKTVKSAREGMELVMARAANVPKVGSMAPDFALETQDGKGSIKLSHFRGRKPVVLIFGSFT